jgi:hypothetical protein
LRIGYVHINTCQHAPNLEQPCARDDALADGWAQIVDATINGRRHLADFDCNGGVPGEVNQSSDNAAVERLVVRCTRQFVAVIKGNCDCTAVGIDVDGSWTA